MKKLAGILTLLAATAVLTGPSPLEAQNANALMRFNGFQNDCGGECPISPGPGECCAVLPPIIVEG